MDFFRSTPIFSYFQILIFALLKNGTGVEHVYLIQKNDVEHIAGVKTTNLDLFKEARFSIFTLSSYFQILKKLIFGT